MRMNDYAEKVLMLRVESARNPMYPVLSLAGEAGEVCGKIGKALRDGEQPEYKAQVAKELGDVLWNIAAIADDMGYSLEEIAQMNIDKLYGRKARGTLQGSGDNR